VGGWPGSHDDRRRTPRPLQSFVGTRGGVRRSLPDVSHGHRAIPNWFCWAGRGVLPGSFIPDIFMGKGMRVADLGLDSRIVEILKGQGIEELYPPQADAIGPALLGENLVLAIPTASGKSLVAYLAILASVLRGGKALYIVPLRALAAEKYEDLKEFESLGIKVGISVGDYDSVDPNLERLDVMVATSERADSLLRHKTNWLQRLSVVVADEVHLINDADRGPTLEVTLAKLRQVNPGAQVLALSATIKNSEELARWLEAEHIRSEWRPVPLKQGVYHDRLVHFTDQSVQEGRAEEDDLSGLVTDIMASGGRSEERRVGKE